ncbi:hypothetical protein Trydic_g18780 [Trypoxylus dichotomus]
MENQWYQSRIRFLSLDKGIYAKIKENLNAFYKGHGASMTTIRYLSDDMRVHHCTPETSQQNGLLSASVHQRQRRQFQIWKNYDNNFVGFARHNLN